MTRCWSISINDRLIMSLRVGAEVYEPGKINPSYAGLRYPREGDGGTFTITCSCGRWEFSGTSAECVAAGRDHDDSPGKSHIVSVLSWRDD